MAKRPEPTLADLSKEVERIDSVLRSLGTQIETIRAKANDLEQLFGKLAGSAGTSFGGKEPGGDPTGTKLTDETKGRKLAGKLTDDVEGRKLAGKLTDDVKGSKVSGKQPDDLGGRKVSGKRPDDGGSKPRKR